MINNMTLKKPLYIIGNLEKDIARDCSFDINEIMETYNDYVIENNKDTYFCYGAFLQPYIVDKNGIRPLLSENDTLLKVALMSYKWMECCDRARYSNNSDKDIFSRFMACVDFSEGNNGEVEVSYPDQKYLSQCYDQDTIQQIKAALAKILKHIAQQNNINLYLTNEN